MIKKLNLSKQERLTILTDAIETNAIQYWACDYGKIKIWRDEDLTITRAEFFANNEKGEKVFYVLNHATIQTGINRILSMEVETNLSIIESVATNDNDADSCDCIIQAALFGEIVYG